MWKLAGSLLFLALTANADEIPSTADAETALSGSEEVTYQIPQKGPDKNMNYQEVYRKVTVDELPGEVKAPALGTRGYRPNLIAVGVGDRTPGAGGMVEYSWNRISAGIAISGRKTVSMDRPQIFSSLYVLYRWFPFAISPYILAGAGTATNAARNFGGLVGAGLEVQVYRSFFVLAGFTFHQTVNRGFPGGSLAWVF